MKTHRKHSAAGPVLRGPRRHLSLSLPLPFSYKHKHTSHSLGFTPLSPKWQEPSCVWSEGEGRLRKVVLLTVSAWEETPLQTFHLPHFCSLLACSRTQRPGIMAATFVNIMRSHSHMPSSLPDKSPTVLISLCYIYIPCVWHFCYPILQIWWTFL